MHAFIITVVVRELGWGHCNDVNIHHKTTNISTLRKNVHCSTMSVCKHYLQCSHQAELHLGPGEAVAAVLCVGGAHGEGCLLHLLQHIRGRTHP